MHPQNWRYPEHKAPKCKKEGKSEHPIHLGETYASLNNWDSQIGTILPGFTGPMVPVPIQPILCSG